MNPQAAAARIEALEADNARLRRLLDGRGLPAELRHQTRNTFAVIHSIVRRSATANRAMSDYVAHLEGRLDAILRVQSAIGASPPDGIDMQAVLLGEFVAHAIDPERQAASSGPGVLLRARAAEVIALAFHELIVNGIKFGALTRPKGRVTVTWTAEPGGPEGRWLAITWQETGGPPTDPAPSSRGFGFEVIERMLPYQLAARTALVFAPEGLRCVIRLPLTPHIARIAPEGDAVPLNDNGLGFQR